MRFLTVCTLLFLIHAASATEATNTIDTERSTMTVRVLKSGLFSAFGHEHQISAPIQQGSFSEANQSVELKVDARKLRVVDKDVSDKDRADIQQTMLGPKVLDADAYPEIRFRASRITRQSDLKWLVQGELALHGQTHPIQVTVEQRQGHYLGNAQIRQKDFGITPVTVGGGTVKVKDELRIEFEIVGK